MNPVEQSAAVAAAPDAAPSPLLAIEGLDVRVGDTEILKGIDLELREGEVVALVGESGSGKSTLVNTIIGLLAPAFTVARGKVTFAGTDLLPLTERELTAWRGARIGYVPQDPGSALNPVKTIGSQVAEVFAIHRPERSGDEVRRRSLELLERVGIDRPEERLRQYPHELSGGLKQRVLIAIAFALEPRLLIADEPTSALDVAVQRQVMAVFDRLSRELGATVIFVTHDIALAADHAARLVVMHEGEIVDAGPLEKVARRPEDEYTRILIRSALAPGSAEAGPHAGPGPEAPVITVRGLAKTFRSRWAHGEGFQAVDDVSFDVPPGTTFALVGESGSGKSTTARILLGLEPPTRGTVRVDGFDVHALRRGQRRELWRHIQLVYQNPYSSLNPRDTVERLISAPLRAHAVGTKAERRARVAELLDALALPSLLATRYPAELSGGQRQRVAIGRALALGARTIVLDEPLSALDVVTQDQILELLKQLQRDRDLTYLFISHDLVIVRHFADHVGVMRRGVLVEAGPVASVFDHPQAPDTQELLAAQPGKRLTEVLAHT